MRREVRDGVCWLTFDRPERLNSFTANDYHDLHTCLSDCSTDDSVRVVVLTATGRAFSAGADRSLLEEGRGDSRERERAGDEFGQLLQVLAALDKPLLAAVNGVAVGFGATLLLYCDLILMAENARLRLPFTAMGIAPEAGSSVLLPLRARWSDAMWAMLSSEWLDATTAVQMGLAWRSVPDSDLHREAAEAAASIAALDSQSVRATKRLMTAGRAEAARLAWAREIDEFRRLLAWKARTDRDR